MVMVQPVTLSIFVPQFFFLQCEAHFMNHQQSGWLHVDLRIDYYRQSIDSVGRYECTCQRGLQHHADIDLPRVSINTDRFYVEQQCKYKLLLFISDVCRVR